MNSIYDYKNNIKLTKTVNGDVVMTLNEPILTTIINCVYDSIEMCKEDGRLATAEDIKKLWDVLYDKSDALNMQNDYSTIKRMITKKNNLTDAEKERLIEILKEM